MSFHLPNELWLEIFSWACGNPTDRYSSCYRPFTSVVPAVGELQTKRVLAQVCRRWNVLATGFLFQDLNVKSGLPALKDVLEKHADICNTVRRITLPYSATTTTYRPQSTAQTPFDILKLCERAEVLVRPPHTDVTRGRQEMRFDCDAECVPLLSIKRIEWWPHSEAERSGGINSLTAALRSAPNLEYLLLGGNIVLGYTDPRPLELSFLSTLRLKGANTLLLAQIATRWCLPHLTHVIIDNPNIPGKNAFDLLWDAYGGQLKTVEFGRHLRFLMGDYLSGCLVGCPQLEQLNYHLFFTLPPELSSVSSSVKIVGLNLVQNDLASEEETRWKLVNDHFNIILGDFLPSLTTIRLHGDWQSTVSSCKFMPWKESCAKRGITLETL